MSADWNICCCCSLLCAVSPSQHPVAKSVHISASACTLRTRCLAPSRAGDSGLSLEQGLRLLCELVQPPRRTLVWVDAADVASMRAVVQFAQQSRATIHVGQSMGSRVAHRVVLNDGWLGTTLAEVAAHAELVITLGDRVLRENPLLPQRFFARADTKPAISWWHITDQPPPKMTIPEVDGSPSPQPKILHWPRSEWHDRLTELQLELDRRPCVSESLAEGLVHAGYSTWIWSNHEMQRSMDELLVRRLLSLARQLTHTTRCTLLNLESHVGQLTAQETLLWLTGCTGAAAWNGTQWDSLPGYADHTPQQWRDAFEHLVLVRSLPCQHPLPEIAPDLLVADNRSASQLVVPGQQPTMLVNSAGLDSPAILFRGDRGTTLAAGPTSATEQQSAEQFFAAAGQRLLAQQLAGTTGG